MGFADDTDDDGTLLNSFLCVLDLEDAALRRAVASLASRLWGWRCGASYKVTESLS